jgi:hypothetical protein
MCNQEHKEILRYENFYHTNVAASPLMLFHCNGKESRLQELYKFPESAPTSCLQFIIITTKFRVYYEKSLVL